MNKSHPSYSDLLKLVPKTSKHFEVKNINLKPEKFPLLKFSMVRFVSRPLVIIMAGVHGDEPAGTITLFRHHDEFFKHALYLKTNLVIYPLINHWGFDHNNLYTKENLNCADNWVHKKIGSTAINVRLIRKELRNDIKGFKKIVFVDLHEDNDIGRGFYLYSFKDRGFEKILLQVARKYFPINCNDNSKNIYDGVIYSEHDGSAEDFMSHQPGVVFSCCTETPSLRPFSVREACDKEIIQTIIKSVSTI